MRDYDPTTGRYLQADPLGLVDGASVYGYARQNPGRYSDARGLFTKGDAKRSLADRHVRTQGPTGFYSDRQVFEEWFRLESGNTRWRNELARCPCNVNPAEGFVAGTQWNPLSKTGIITHIYHGSGPEWQMRSLPTPSGHGNQCMYDAVGSLIRGIPAAGSADFVSPDGPGGVWGTDGHRQHDVLPYNLAEKLGRVDDYFIVRPVY